MTQIIHFVVGSPGVVDANAANDRVWLAIGAVLALVCVATIGVATVRNIIAISRFADEIAESQGNRKSHPVKELRK